MSDAQFVGGLRVFAPRDGAPSFIKANMVIERDAMIAWLQAHGETVRVDIKESKNGKLYAAVNTYQRRTQEQSGGGNPAQAPAAKPADDFSDDVPF